MSDYRPNSTYCERRLEDIRGCINMCYSLTSTMPIVYMSQELFEMMKKEYGYIRKNPDDISMVFGAELRVKELPNGMLYMVADENMRW